MVLQLFLGILIAAMVFLLVNRNKRRRLWPILMLGLLVVLSVLFFEHYRLLSDKTMAYQWLSYEELQARFIITSDVLLGKALQILLPLTMAMLYLNLISKREEYPLNAGNIMLLCLAAFILMFSSQDFIQLMAGSCCFSILGFYLINENTAKNKFIFYNFIAEMAIFTALAIVYAKTGDVRLNTLDAFVRNGWHKDLVSILLIIGVLMKSGMFLFQNQLLDLQKLSFNRMLYGALFVAPLSGLVLYVKLHPLFLISQYTTPILYGILCCTAVLSLLGMLFQDNIKAKILYFYMLFFAFALFEIHRAPENFVAQVIPMLPSVLLVGWGLMLASVSASDEVYVSQMGGFARALHWNLLLALFVTAVFIGSVLQIENTWMVWSFAGVSLFALAAILHAVYLGKNNADEKVTALLRNAGWLYAIPILAGSAVSFYALNTWQAPLFWGMLGGFVCLWLLLPQKLVNLFAENESLQENDWQSTLYRLIIVSPLRLLGRILWLAVDFVVIERSIIGTLSGSMEFLENGFNRLQTQSGKNYLILTLVGIALLLLNIGIYVHE